MPVESPVVSVIIATYNWSSVLSYSIQSVLWQTFQDFELLVIGDGCTDDSEEVVASFNDDRIKWHNLPENTGNQWMPNNKGIELAKGTYVAYLGHDDVWHPSHLEALIHKIEAAHADIAYSVAELISPLAHIQRMLTGLSESGEFEPKMLNAPSAVLHHRDMHLDIGGGWRDYRELRVGPDQEFFWRAYQHGKRFVATNELTVFKFPAVMRPNSYIERPSHEQAEYIRRIQQESEFRYHELMKIVSLPFHVRQTFSMKPQVLGEQKPGEIVESLRKVRGLAPNPALELEAKPIYLSWDLLHALNAPVDITPLECRQQLHKSQMLPRDGIFVGENWLDPQQDEWGRVFRWAQNDAEIVVTQPTGMSKRITIDLRLGPGVNRPTATLQVLVVDTLVVAEALVGNTQLLEFELPIAEGEGTIFKLHIEGGDQVESNGRYLNFRVYNLDWAEAVRSGKLEKDIERLIDELAHALSHVEVLRREITLTQQEAQLRESLQEEAAALHAQINTLANSVSQLDSFRTTSLRYWLHRVRTSPKLRRWLRRG